MIGPLTSDTVTHGREPLPVAGKPRAGVGHVSDTGETCHREPTMRFSHQTTMSTPNAPCATTP